MRNTFKIFFLLLLSIESPAQIYNIVKVMQTDIDDGRGMHTNNNYVFVADGNSGIKIFQTSTNSFNLITFFDTDGSANSVFVSGDFLFVADSSKGIKVYFIQNIAAPVLMDSEQVGNATFVTLKGNYLYAIVDYDFLIFDISNTAALNLLSRVNTTGNSTPFTIVINGSAAYLPENGSDGGMEVYNISNPNSPALSTKFTYTGICYDAVIHQGTLHVTQGYFMHHYSIGI